MGLLVDGIWQDSWYETRQGRFERESSHFRDHVTPDGHGGFKAEPHRYHLYVSLACPWAHRTLIMRRLKGLEGTIGLSVVHWIMGEQGWSFHDGPGVIPDPGGAPFLHQVYTRARPDYTGRVTVPVLWDRQRRTIVSNESSEILRMFGSAFDAVGARAGDYTPAALQSEIDALNARIYDTVNNGVYKAGFATRQEVYEDAVLALFDTLDWLEQRLSQRTFLLGDTLTEADIRLVTTLFRFDAVYVGHFKCNLRRLTDYPELWDYARTLYQWPGIRDTVSFTHIKGHYYGSHPTINPNRIVPVGPLLDWDAPTRRSGA
ncbi:glutathione S-transferase family protein [Lichenicoccus sp.]|uniref:glutathione S-transferase family protein n=1 Tax=Lichenicoccus sp. TaxID=2781899 RepID=UPI003D0CA504